MTSPEKTDFQKYLGKYDVVGGNVYGISRIFLPNLDRSEINTGLLGDFGTGFRPNKSD